MPIWAFLFGTKPNACSVFGEAIKAGGRGGRGRGRGGGGGRGVPRIKARAGAEGNI